MTNSKQIARLIGPTIIAITSSELVNIHIWTGNTAAGVHLNGALLFVAGLSIVQGHNRWVRDWSLSVTLAGWFAVLTGLLRMLTPELQLAWAKNTSGIIVSALVVLVLGIFLTIEGYAGKIHSQS